MLARREILVLFSMGQQRCLFPRGVKELALAPFNPQLFSYKTIFQTAQVHTFPKKKWMTEFCLRTRHFLQMIISLILITFSLDNVLRSVGENWCWSFSGLNPNNDDSQQVANKKAFFTNSWTPKTSSFHSRGVLLQWRVMWGCSTLTYNPFSTLLFTISDKKS